MEALLLVAGLFLGPALLVAVLAKARRRRQQEIAAMPDVPSVLHGTSEATMAEYLQTAEPQDRQGALSEPKSSDGGLSLSDGDTSDSDDGV